MRLEHFERLERKVRHAVAVGVASDCMLCARTRWLSERREGEGNATNETNGSSTPYGSYVPCVSGPCGGTARDRTLCARTRRCGESGILRRALPSAASSSGPMGGSVRHHS